MRCSWVWFLILQEGQKSPSDRLGNCSKNVFFFWTFISCSVRTATGRLSGTRCSRTTKSSWTNCTPSLWLMRGKFQTSSRVWLHSRQNLSPASWKWRDTLVKRRWVRVTAYKYSGFHLQNLIASKDANWLENVKKYAKLMLCWFGACFLYWYFAAKLAMLFLYIPSCCKLAGCIYCSCDFVLSSQKDEAQPQQPMAE